jgi:hypothetical protein
MGELSDLNKLVWPFPKAVIKPPPAGKYGSYVGHDVVEQRLLIVCGPPRTSLVKEVRGDVPMRKGKPATQNKAAVPDKPPLNDVVCGVVLRMEATIDAEERWAEEAGDTDPHNWEHDGQRMKDAMSDAYKRCALRLGVGLHLRDKDGNYDLHLRMQAANEVGQGVEPGEETGTDDELVPTDHAEQLEQWDAAAAQVPPDGPAEPVPPSGSPPAEPAPSGDERPDAGQTASSAPQSGGQHPEHYTAGPVGPDTWCADCDEPIGDHTIRRGPNRWWCHKVCPRDKKAAKAAKGG